MKTITRKPGTTLFISILIGFFAMTLMIPQSANAAFWNRHNDNQHGRAYGHYVAPPHFLTFFEQFEEKYGWLPPGIARILDRYGIDHDDDNPTEPSLDNSSVAVSTSSAEIMFEFDEDVQARVFVSDQSGFDRNDDDVMKMVERDYMGEHSFLFEGLEPDTEYFYRIQFRDEDDNTVLSDEMNFRTDEEVSGEPDETAPELLETNVTPSTTSASLSVEFDKAVQAQLYVSTHSGFDRDADDTVVFSHSDFMDEHEFELTGLASNTEYFYNLRFRDESGNTENSEEFSFITTEETEELDETAPLVSDISGTASTSSIEVHWTTDEPATSAVYTSTSTGFSVSDVGLKLTEDVTLTTNHMLTLEGLTASTSYFHRIVSEDEAGNETVSNEFSFDTI